MPCAIEPETPLDEPLLLELLEELLELPEELPELLELLEPELLEPLLEAPLLELLELLLLSLPQALRAQAANTISARFFMVTSPEKGRRLLLNPGRLCGFCLNSALPAQSDDENFRSGARCLLTVRRMTNSSCLLASGPPLCPWCGPLARSVQNEKSGIPARNSGSFEASFPGFARPRFRGRR
jgi:hypothetical protein